LNKVFVSKRSEDILLALYFKGELTKTELREATGCGGQTAKDVVKHFMDLGVVVEKYDSVRGRNVLELTVKGRRVAEYLVKIYRTLGLKHPFT